MRLLLVTLIFFGYSAIAAAQNLYMPRDVKHAFENGTRSLDGKPGKNYWQNRAKYTISISALPPDREIKGKEQITYVNNSPNALREIVFKLILNIHKPTALRYGNSGADYNTSGIHIDYFSLNGKPFPWPENQRPNTWQLIKLSTPIAPHDSVQLTIKWHNDISLASNREGMIDSTTYFLAYFYPRVAVYDDYQGWDTNEFNELLEFYNDFNDYSFTVEVPKNYIVWATGALQNPESVLNPEFQKRLTESMGSDKAIHVASKKDLLSKKVTAQNKTNIWTWKANNISDISVALSDHFVWDASSVVVDNATHRRASVQAAFNDTAADFHQMVGFGKHALDWFSRNWPGVPYPYSKIWNIP
ncbi:MAG: hypothetical protein NVS1B13_13240 [Flavisolibacter sp.]